MNAGYRIRKLTQWIALVALVVATLPGPALAQSEVTPAISVQDNPTTLIGGVTSYYLRDPKPSRSTRPHPVGLAPPRRRRSRPTSPSSAFRRAAG